VFFGRLVKEPTGFLTSPLSKFVEDFMSKTVRYLFACSALFLTFSLYYSSCGNPAGGGNGGGSGGHLLTGRFDSDYSSGTGVFYADYADTGLRALAVGDGERELKGKIEDGDIVFTLFGYMDEGGNFSLSAGSSVLVYQITGRLSGGSLSDTKVCIQIKTGDNWVEHIETVTQTDDVEIAKPDSPGQTAILIPAAWQGGWQGKEASAAGYDTLILTPSAIIDYPPAGAALTISLLEPLTVDADTLEFILLGKNSSEQPAYYKCRLIKSGIVLLWKTYLDSETPVMTAGALATVKEYNVGSDAGTNVKTVTLSRVDRTALGAAISAADAAKDGVVVSVDGSDVFLTDYWVTSAQMDAFNGAIAAANAAYGDMTADQAAVNAALTALQGAAAAFTGQKQPGLLRLLIGGIYVLNDEPKAAYWVGGARYELPSSGMPGIRGIAFIGNDMYIAGFDDGPCYWKNGSRYSLPVGGSGEGSAQGIAVSGTDVYITGHYYTGSGYQACYWKNGVRTDLNGPDGFAWGIAVSGTAVYVAGDSDYHACYWLNGTRYGLPDDGGAFSAANAVALSGADVYVAGSYYDGTDVRPCYWKNGIKYNLDGNSAGSVAVSGSDVYILGGYRTGDLYKPCYWKNGTRHSLPIPADGGNTSAIAFNGGDVYILGEYNENDYHKAVYWKNGFVTGLPADLLMAEAIAIK
jgi:hypothetical protein